MLTYHLDVLVAQDRAALADNKNLYVRDLMKRLASYEPIKVEQEPKERGKMGLAGIAAHTQEPCCFCWRPTRFWVLMPNKKGKLEITGESMACCEACAATYPSSALPTKKDWCDAVGDAMDKGLSPYKNPYGRPPETPR